MRKQNLKMLMAIVLIGMTTSYRILEGAEKVKGIDLKGSGPKPKRTRGDLNHDLRKAMDHHEMKLSLQIAIELVKRDFDLNEGEVDAILKVFHRTLDGLKMRLEYAVEDFDGSDEERTEMLTLTMEKLVGLIEDFILMINEHIVPHV